MQNRCMHIVIAAMIISVLNYSPHIFAAEFTVFAKTGLYCADDQSPQDDNNEKKKGKKKKGTNSEEEPECD